MHRKIDALMTLRPDVAVISEAAKPERLVACVPELADASLVWVGKYPDRGLLLAGFGKTVLGEFDRHCHGDPLRWIAPVSVSGLPGLKTPLHLLGVCAQKVQRKDDPGPLRQALRRYRGFLQSAPAVVAGDFNNNMRFDRRGWPKNHANAVRDLASLGLVSAYHVERSVEAGNEPEPTYFQYRRATGGYHIDYVFMPEEWANRAFTLMVGRYQDWIEPGLSDHVPLVLDITTPPWEMREGCARPYHRRFVQCVCGAGSRTEGSRVMERGRRPCSE
ncbi:MAG: hypothetical protein OXU81_21025 [Gammaproteobacteria bacterium]|nr:hypothetical protein [Gammaproteobacteria bacterium]